MITQDRRIDWVDRAKGLAILCIVVGHVWHKLQKMQLEMSPQLYHAVDAFLYSFHVPVFFFISGMFFWKTLGKRSASATIKRRARLLLYPYLLWSLLQTAVEMVGMSNPGHSVVLHEFLRILYWPRAHFWFLYDLFVMMALCALFSQWFPKRGVKLFTGLAVALFFAYGSMDILWLNDLGRNMIYFVGGLWSFSWLSKVSADTPPTRRINTFCIFLFLGLAAGLIYADLNNVLIFRALLAFAGIAATLSVAMLWPSNRSVVLNALGQRSLEIYVAHVLVAFGLMDVLNRIFGLIMPWPVWLFIGTVAGVIFPLLLYRTCERLRFPWLFRLPERS